MIENRLGEEQGSLESCDYYSLYKEDATLKKDNQPCSLAQLVRFSSILDKVLMAMGCFFALGNGISLIFYAQPLKDLIMAFDPHSNPQEILANLTNAIKGFFLNSIFVFLNASLMTVAWTISSQRQLIRVRSLYFKSLLAQQFAWYDRNKPEQVCSQMYTQTQRAQNSLVQSITGILTSLSMGFGGLIFAFSRGWKMAIVMAGFLPVMFLTNYISSRLARKWENQMVDKVSNTGSNIIEIFENIKTVKYLGGEQYQVSRFSQELQRNSTNNIIYKRKTAITSAINFFCIIFNYALGFWYGAKLVADKVFNSTSGKTYDVGDVISIFFCIYISNLNFSGISGHFNNFYNSRVALTRIIDIIDRRPRQSQGQELCISAIQEIQFRNITFHFSKPLFNGLNITIKKGVVAIVGSSGNGKSTLLNLLMKFYEPFRGEIFLSNGNRSQQLKNIQAKSLRNRIGYVGQEPVLLGSTIRKVLSYSHNTDEAIWRALELCCAQQFTRHIGLDSDYTSLSGGQKQRIAIARAVLREPEILILDEGTSALDGINQRKLLTNLKQRSAIKFIIMIAHRTETLSEAHTIIKIDKGCADIIQNRDNKETALVLQQPIQHQASKGFQAIQVAEQTNKDKQEEPEQQKAKFKLKYFTSVLKLNKGMFRHYVFGITTAMLLGAIFPAFSFIITRLCAIVTDIQYATTDLEVEQLRAKASQISLLLMLFSLLSIIFTIVKIHSFLYIGQSIGIKTKLYAFKQIITRQLAEIQKAGKSNLIQLINSNCDSVKGLVSNLIENAAQHFFTLIIGLSISFVYCWQITLVSFFLLPMSLIGGKLQQKFLGSLAQNSDKVHRKTHDIVMKSIIHNRTVKSLNLQEYFFQKYQDQQQRGFRKSIRDSVFSGIMLGISQCLISGMLSLIYYIGAILVQDYGVSIVDLFTAIYAIMFSGVQAGCNIGFISSIALTTFGTARFFHVLQLQDKDLSRQFAEDERIDKNELVQQLHDESVIGSSDLIKGNVEFREITFKYPNRNEYLFKDLSFKVTENERVAIVGQSGTGKTTIADLLFRIYRQEEGQVLVDGVSSTFYSRSSLLQQMAIVSQQPALFNRSIQQNIRYNSNASLTDVQEAAKISKAFDFVEKGGFGVEQDSEERLGKGEAGGNWDRVVGSRGSLLSGGQKQRVAIARAIVRKPKIMVFDEATSALDKQTQESLLLNVSNALKMTQIIIAHRLSTIRSCDRIIVLKYGRVVQMGTYGQLIQRGGQFANLVNALQNAQQP